LFKTKVADFPEPDEPQADNSSNPQSQAGYRITFHPGQRDEHGQRPPIEVRGLESFLPVMQEE
jgi:hypothetical protein